MKNVLYTQAKFQCALRPSRRSNALLSDLLHSLLQNFTQNRFSTIGETLNESLSFSLKIVCIKCIGLDNYDSPMTGYRYIP